MDIKYPSMHDKDPERKFAGSWVLRQRTMYRLGKLSQRQIDKLEQIPGWTWVQNDSSKKKNEFLEMARKGEARPKGLWEYTNKKSKSFDAEFGKKIQTIAPSWLVSVSDKNKKKLIELAQTGKPLSFLGTNLKKALRRYTAQNSKSFDAGFNKIIRKLAPDWFVNSAEKNKKRLFEMARAKEPRPSSKTALGSVLCNYTNMCSHCYDPKFNQGIREMNPDWFTHGNCINQRKAG